MSTCQTYLCDHCRQPVYIFELHDCSEYFRAPKKLVLWERECEGCGHTLTDDYFIHSDRYCYLCDNLENKPETLTA